LLSFDHIKYYGSKYQHNVVKQKLHFEIGLTDYRISVANSLHFYVLLSISICRFEMVIFIMTSMG